MIMPAASTALLFDHRTGTVKPVSYDGELESLRKLLDVDLVDIIRVDRSHIMFVDDEGLLVRHKMGFAVTYRGNTIQFAGSGLLTGDRNGENAPISLNFADLKIEGLQFSYED